MPMPPPTSSRSRRLRRQLIDRLHADEVLVSPHVATAFAEVPRELFIPELLERDGLEAVYRDEAVVTKRDARGMPLSSSSQPAIMAKMLELLELRPGQRVLEIGAGTGYNAALLAHIVGPAGEVTSVDVDPDVARGARRAVREAGARATVVAGDGRNGHSARAPYDRIIVTASAEDIRRTWLEQLAEGGRLELPLRLDRDGAAIQLIGALERRGRRLHLVSMTWGGFMPLHGGDGGWRPPRAALGAQRSDQDTHSSLVSITGGGVAGLSEGTARRLLAAALTGDAEPVAHGMTRIGSSHPPMLLIYLLLTIPAARRVTVHGGGRLGIGIVDRRAGGLAVLSVRSPWGSDGERRRTRTRWRLDGYGGGGGAAELEALVERWHELRQTERDRLKLTAYGSGERLRLRYGWGA
jgi:protein-L-isoaspartate(D-aspartate) O-methyltransferase